MADFGGLLSRAKAPAVATVEPMAPVPEVEGEEDGMKERLMPLAQELIDAVRGGDADGAVDALIAIHAAQAAGPSESDEV